MGLLNGNQIRIRVNGTVLTGETRNGLSYSNNLVEVTTKPTAGFPEYISGIKTTTVDFDKLFLLNEALNVGDIVQLHVGGRITGQFASQAIVESIEISGSSDDVVTYAGTLRVIGELEQFVPTYINQTWCQNNNQPFCTSDGQEICFTILDS